MNGRAAFIDRDGTINEDRGYVHKPEDFVLIPGALEALKCLTDSKITIYIITNQSGIGRGYYSEKDFQNLNAYMLDLFIDAGITVEEVLYCPHHPDASLVEYRQYCDCRKPASGLIQKVMRKNQYKKDNLVVIGDKNSDVESGKSLGLVTYLVETGFGFQEKESTRASFVVRDLKSAVLHLSSHWKGL